MPRDLGERGQVLEQQGADAEAAGVVGDQEGDLRRVTARSARR